MTNDELLVDLADAARRYLNAPRPGTAGSGTITIEARQRLQSILRKVDRAIQVTKSHNTQAEQPGQ